MSYRHFAFCLLSATFVVTGCPGPETPWVTLINECDGRLSKMEYEEYGVVDGPWDKDGDGFFDGNDEACAEQYDLVDCDDRAVEDENGEPVGALRHPDHEEICDGIDNDCDGDIDEDDFDEDGDGWTTCAGDCVDSDPTIHPGMVELCEAGDVQIDQNCDGDFGDFDRDMDGYKVCEGDCNDWNTLIHPGRTELLCNDVDEDCDPTTTAVDEDLDGFDTCLDCDDADAAIHPGAEELCDDVDQDCDGDLGFDGDNDGHLSCEGDCDDGEATIHPGAYEQVCDGIDQDCDPATTDPDVDGDGHSDCTDCDDADPTVHPGAFDACNWIDEDCDGDFGPWDSDNDGHLECQGDCDDTDAAINPGQPEIACNTVDDDCDPLTPDLADGDGDGSSCSDDCDDDNPLIYPGAPEICGDGVAQDCGGTDAACPTTSTLADCNAAIFGAEPGQRVGNAYAIGDVTGDGVGDLVLGASSWDQPGLGTNDDAGAVWILHGPVPELMDHDLSDPTATGLVVTRIEGSSSGARFGASVAIGDFDGDGSPDLAVTAPNDKALFLFRTDFVEGTVADTGADAIYAGVAIDRDGLGAGLAINDGSFSPWDKATLVSPGDRDADGYDDLLIGVPYAHGGANDRGAIYVLSGQAIVWNASTGSLVTDGSRFKGQYGKDMLGAAVAAADLDGDGLLELVAGRPTHQTSWNHQRMQVGGAEVLAGGSSWQTGNQPLPATIGIDDSGALTSFGASVASAGYTGALTPWGTEYEDLLVGAPTTDGAELSAGAVYVFDGLDVVAGGLDVTNAYTTVVGYVQDQHLGSALAPAGDLNLDGFGDFVIGAEGTSASTASPGSVHVVYGPLPGGTLSAANLPGPQVPGLVSGDGVGSFLAPAGDLVGSSAADIVIGAPGDSTAASEAGAVYICESVDF